MAVLEKIRVKFGLAISIIIALALLSFIIDPSTLQSAFNSLSSKNNVGEIAGNKISYNDYASSVENEKTIFEGQYGPVAGEQAQQYVQDLAWNEYLGKYVYNENADNAGFVVGDDELIDILRNNVFGESFDAIVAQSGQVAYYNLLWNNFREQVYSSSMRGKYFSLLSGATLSTPLSVAQGVEANTMMNIDYVQVPVTPDSTVTVSASEINAYYKAHKDFFRQVPNRDVEYVYFENRPSDADVEAAQAKMAEYRESFVADEAPEQFLRANASNASLDTKTWYKAADFESVSHDVSEFVEGAQAGDVSDIIRIGNDFCIVRVLEQAVDSARVAMFQKNIKISDETKTTVYGKAQQFLAAANGSYADFQAACSDQAVVASPANINVNTESLGFIKAKEAIRWANDNKAGKVSDLIKVNSNADGIERYLVVAVKAVSDTKFIPVEKVASQIEAMLLASKLSAKAKADVAAKIEGKATLEEIAAELGVEVKSAASATFAQANLPAAIVGAASVAQEGVVSAPVADDSSVYVFKVAGTEKGGYTAEDVVKNEAQRAQISASYVGSYIAVQNADIEDNRGNFF